MSTERDRDRRFLSTDRDRDRRFLSTDRDLDRSRCDFLSLDLDRERREDFLVVSAERDLDRREDFLEVSAERDLERRDDFLSLDLRRFGDLERRDDFLSTDRDRERLEDFLLLPDFRFSLDFDLDRRELFLSPPPDFRRFRLRLDDRDFRRDDELFFPFLSLSGLEDDLARFPELESRRRRLFSFSDSLFLLSFCSTSSFFPFEFSISGPALFPVSSLLSFHLFSRSS